MASAKTYAIVTPFVRSYADAWSTPDQKVRRFRERNPGGSVVSTGFPTKKEADETLKTMCERSRKKQQ